MCEILRDVPPIFPVPEGGQRPLWSVMIPTYNRSKYLAQSLRSVLDQALDQDQMQIEVVDNCSTQNDPAEIVKVVGQQRVAVYRQPLHVSMSANFNTCIERARGQLVHILHDDDSIANGYYGEIANLVERFPKLGLYATRSFFINEESVIVGVTDRAPELKRPGTSVGPFFYTTPIQCAGVTVRRRSYEELGGFRTDLVYTLDCEMWARITGVHGAIVSDHVMGRFRVYSESTSSRLAKMGENVRDVCRLNRIFAERYTEFSVDLGRRRISDMAWQQYQQFLSLGDELAAAENYELWLASTSTRRRVMLKLKQRLLPYVRSML